MRALSWIIVATTLSGCIIEPPDLVKDAGTPFDGGIAVPPLSDAGFGWDGGLGGGGGGGGGSGGGGGVVPGTGSGATFPGSGKDGDRGTGVLWLVRIDRGTANLAASYAPLVRGMNEQLAAQGFDVRTTAVGSLHQARLLWSGSGKSVATSELESALEGAAASDSATTTCSTSSLSTLGRQLSTLSPFATPLSTLLVVVLDHGARPVAYGATPCAENGSAPADWFGAARSPTRWLNTSTGAWNLPRAQTRFLFISTPENETYAQTRERCAGMSAFPRTALDALSPSSIAYYEPLSEGLNRFQPNLGSRRDLCQAVAQDWTGYASGFAKSWAQLLSLPEDKR